MMDILAAHGGTVVLVVFFSLFVGIGLWAYRPANKQKLEDYARIPLKESDDGDA